MIKFEKLITNNKGLHARASAKLVELVESFDAECEISNNQVYVSGDSIMGLLMLAASKGTNISIKVWGRQSEDLAKQIVHLIDNGFGEND